MTLYCLTLTTDSGPSSYKSIAHYNLEEIDDLIHIILTKVILMNEIKLYDDFLFIILQRDEVWALTLLKNPKNTETVLTWRLLSTDNVWREVHNMKCFYNIIVFVKDTGHRGVFGVLHISCVCWEKVQFILVISINYTQLTSPKLHALKSNTALLKHVNNKWRHSNIVIIILSFTSFLCVTSLRKHLE